MSLIDDLALSMIDFLDRGIVDLLKQHGGIAWTASDRISLPSNFTS